MSNHGLAKYRIFDHYPYDDGNLQRVYDEAQGHLFLDGKVLVVEGVTQTWYFDIPKELRESIKKAPRPERLILLYELLHRGLVMFRDNNFYHIGTLNSEIISKLNPRGSTDHLYTDGCHFFDLAHGASRAEITDLRPEDMFFNHFSSDWELEIFFDYDI